MSACQAKPQPEGCMNPCDDVFLCATVERGFNSEGTTGEYVYTITVQNCSSSVISGQIDVILGKGVCSDESPSVPTNNPLGDILVPSDFSACSDNGTFNNMWNGVIDTVVISNLQILPGSFQFWFRFSRELTDYLYLPSTVKLSGRVRDPLCKNPCRIEKCIRVDGDCLTHL